VDGINFLLVLSQD